ncbi:MAG: ABC transporter substrate-binding protein [Desulfomonile tiedjei]|nr:ABC transporter substrate-binding protein [Desulfomonile tiedjei]
MKKIVYGLVSILAFSAFLSSAPALSQEPVKIGFIYVFSGRLSNFGHMAKQGAEFAIEEVNASGGVLGRKLVAVYEDTQMNPARGVELVKKLVADDKVDVLMGITSSGVADAVVPVVPSLKTPLIITLAMNPDVTGEKCNPYTFRISMNGPQNIKAAAILASSLPAKKWTTIGPDYLFGYQCWEYFQKYLKPQRSDTAFASQSDVVWAPITTTDFAPYIKKAINTDADGVLISLFAGNLIDFVRQAAPLGFFDGKRQVLVNIGSSVDVMYGLGLDMPKGIWIGGFYWFQQNRTQVNQDFVDAYYRKYKFPPDYNAHGGYSGVKAYVAALQKAGTTNKESVIKALEGLVLDLPIGKTLIRAEDHQAVLDAAWGLTSDFDSKYRCRLLKPLKVFPGDEITMPVEQTGCKMPR